VTSIGLTLDETICFESLVFITDRFGNLSLSPEGNDSGIILVRMVHSGSPSLHTILEDSSDEGDPTSGEGELWHPCPSRMQHGDPRCPHS
jgi:hypothetical protein